MDGREYIAPQFRQGVQMYMPPTQQDCCPPYPSIRIHTRTTTSQYYMVHQGYSSLTSHLGQPDSTIHSHLSPCSVPQSRTPISGYPYSIPPPQLHLNGKTQLMQSFPSAQLDLQWTQNVNQIPSHLSQPSLLSPGQAPSSGLVWPTFPVRVQAVQPNLQPDPPLSSSMLYARAFGPVAYTAPQVFRTPSALVPSLPPPPPRVPPPLPPSSPLGRPRACIMSSATLLPSSSHINRFWYDGIRNTGVSHLNTDSDIDMEDDMTKINEEQIIPEKQQKPQLPTLPTRNSLATILSSSESSVLKEERIVAEHKVSTLLINTITARPGAPNTVGEDYLISLQGHVDEPAGNSSLKPIYKSNSVDREQSVHVYMHNDESDTAVSDVEIEAAERSKSLKRFKVALAKFVRKVLGPFWRQCCMTKEVFKMIVKKTVDKVSGSLKPHHIPKSQAKINRYIDLSRSKLISLVMAYIDKYVRV